MIAITISYLGKLIALTLSEICCPGVKESFNVSLQGVPCQGEGGCLAARVIDSHCVI